MFTKTTQNRYMHLIIIIHIDTIALIVDVLSQSSVYICLKGVGQEGVPFLNKLSCRRKGPSIRKGTKMGRSVIDLQSFHVVAC